MGIKTKNNGVRLYLKYPELGLCCLQLMDEEKLSSYTVGEGKSHTPFYPFSSSELLNGTSCTDSGSRCSLKSWLDNNKWQAEKARSSLWLIGWKHIAVQLFCEPR